MNRIMRNSGAALAAIFMALLLFSWVWVRR